MSARPLAKDIIPEKACIGVLGQSLAAAPLGVRVVENLRPVASPDKEQSTEGQHAPGLGRGRGRAGASGVSRSVAVVTRQRWQEQRRRGRSFP
jgi:hypothetical protein